MKEKKTKPTQLSCSVEQLTAAFKDPQLYTDFHVSVEDQGLEFGDWNADCSRTSAFDTSIDGTMARIALQAKRVLVHERTTIKQLGEEVEVSVQIRFSGVRKLEQMESTVHTRLQPTGPGSCAITHQVKVHNNDSGNQFVESGMLTSLTKSAEKWVKFASAHVPAPADRVTLDVLNSEEEEEAPLASKLDPCVLCHSVNAVSIFLNMLLAWKVCTQPGNVQNSEVVGVEAILELLMLGEALLRAFFSQMQPQWVPGLLRGVGWTVWVWAGCGFNGVVLILLVRESEFWSNQELQLMVLLNCGLQVLRCVWQSVLVKINCGHQRVKEAQAIAVPMQGYGTV